MNRLDASKKLQKLKEEKPLLEDYCKKNNVSQASVVSSAGFNGRCLAPHKNKHVHHNSLGKCFLISDLGIFV
jgi:hypothetical protein